VAGDPVLDLLGQGRLGVGVVRGAEDGDEQLDRDPLARGRVDEARLLARVIDEELLAGVVDLALVRPRRPSQRR
jgi:alkanesulfonate monooxygenase SsuD/methylene tetrahydromethanopterin reductase-like flavin-dependent oxidoreductase (luciferase family)